MRPHVLYATPILGYPPIGGPRLRTYYTLKALARCADVSLYVTRQPDVVDRDAARAHLLTLCRAVHFPEPPPQPPLVRRAAHALVPASARAALRRLRRSAPSEPAGQATPDPAVLDAVRAWVEEHRPDVIWLGFGGIARELVPLKESTPAPVVLETESVWSRFILRELPFAKDAKQRERILREGGAKEAEERWCAQRVDLTTAVSEVDAEYFRSIAPTEPTDRERVMLLANVIDVDEYATLPERSVRLDQPALLFSGLLSHGTANVDAALWLLDEIMPIVWRRRPEVHLYIVGNNPAPAILARRGARVHVTGRVPSIVPYLRASVAAVVPLRWESGTRFKILEAFACKTPVVSTGLGAEGLEVQHGQHLLLADDAMDFADAIMSVIDDKQLANRLVEPAYGLVREKYDLSSAEHQIARVLERLGFGATARV